jgi:type I restriction enzyme R subunit
VIDVFAEAGIDRPDISLLSEEFLEEVRHMPQRNLAAEALQRLLADQIRVRMTRNAVQARKFSEMLEASIRRYQNRSIEAAQVILELIELAREMREADKRGEDLGLSQDELAFYDALAENQSAVDVLGDENLKVIAIELVNTVRNNATIDWTVKESVKARLRVLVRRALRKYGYPPIYRRQPYGPCCYRLNY